MKGGLHWAVCEAPGETFLSLIYSWDLLGLSLSLLGEVRWSQALAAPLNPMSGCCPPGFLLLSSGRASLILCYPLVWCAPTVLLGRAGKRCVFLLSSWCPPAVLWPLLSSWCPPTL